MEFLISLVIVCSLGLWAFRPKPKRSSSVSQGYVSNKKSKLSETEILAKTQELDDKQKRLTILKEEVISLAKEKQQGFPTLAKAYDRLFELEDRLVIQNLAHRATKAAETVKKYSQLRREAEYQKTIALNLIDYYKSIVPSLAEIEEETEVPNLTDSVDSENTAGYLTKAEYEQLSSTQRNQLALDRFWSRSKSKKMLGKIYERYVGYLYEAQGYTVSYTGIFGGLEDLGRDLICKKGKTTIIIQCKNWAAWKTIFEKHIFQFFGTVFQYKHEHPEEKVKAVFYTTTEVSPLAKQFASELHIEIREKFKLESYPCIKCHTSKHETETAKEGTKIYHLPFDQMYDKVGIEKSKGEFYALTVAEAENAGFRRAFRYTKMAVNNA